MTVPIDALKLMRRVQEYAADDEREDRVIRCVEPEGLEVTFGYACGPDGIGTWVKVTQFASRGYPTTPDTVEGEIHECDPDVWSLKYSNSRFAEVATDRENGR